MNAYEIREISPEDAPRMAQVRALLARSNLRLDRSVDATIGAYDADGALVGTGSLFDNTLRSIAVEESLRGEGLLALLCTKLTEMQARRGNHHIFLYTKPESAPRFMQLGYWEIARAGDQVVFMENKQGAFRAYLGALKQSDIGAGACVVMNANPFTLGHRHLIEQAARAHDCVHVFVVSQDRSAVPFRDRYEMVARGVSDLPQARLHPSGSYIVSNATFPSYFLQDDARVMREHARLDLNVFVGIARALHIDCRYIGEEPFSAVTGIYNDVMRALLPEHGIACREIPRLCVANEPVSASAVRRFLREGEMKRARALVPETTYAYLTDPAHAAILQNIRASKEEHA